MARVPAATRAAVSRAEARSSTSRASSNPYFCMPARSAWPGPGLVSTLEGGPGSGDISSSHLGHSVLAISMATGDPRVRPWRMPPMSVISSASKRIRGPRPYPRRRRASSHRCPPPSPADRPAAPRRSRPGPGRGIRRRSGSAAPFNLLCPRPVPGPAPGTPCAAGITPGSGSGRGVEQRRAGREHGRHRPDGQRRGEGVPAPPMSTPPTTTPKSAPDEPHGEGQIGRRRLRPAEPITPASRTSPKPMPRGKNHHSGRRARRRPPRRWPPRQVRPGVVDGGGHHEEATARRRRRRADGGVPGGGQIRRSPRATRPATNTA